MGNRAIITTQEQWENNGYGIYLHWNGGYDSINAFTTYARYKGIRDDSSYMLARLSQIIGNWFGGTLSVGITNVNNKWEYADDNGVYIIGDNCKIVDRKLYDGDEQDSYDLFEMVESINEAQPTQEQIKPSILRAMYMMDLYPITYDEKLEMINKGTEIYLRDYDGSFERFEILGYGDESCGCNGVVNGQNVVGIPYFNFRKYDREYRKSIPDKDIDLNNINNYLTENKEFYFA